MSQLLARLDAQLQTAVDPVAIAEIQIKRSCYLSRTGYFEESRQIIADLRKSFGGGQNARISVWIMLAEGLAEIFQNLSPTARDRISRAQLIALAMKDPELGSLTSAWRAHVEFELSNFEAMATALRKAYELAARDNHDARARVAITMASCFFLLGDRQNGQRWFMRCREHALLVGDQATIDALLYNRAAFGIASLRVHRCFSDLDDNLVSLVQMELASAKNFQIMTRDLSLANLNSLSEARVLFLKGEYQAAYDGLKSIRSAGPFAKYNFSEQMVDLESALCLALLDKPDEAKILAHTCAKLDLSAFDIDDQLVLAWVRKQLVAKIPELSEVLEAMVTFETLEVHYRVQAAALTSLLMTLDQELGSPGQWLDH